MKEVYLVFTHSNSIIAKLIRFFSKEKYSHVSLSFDDSCEHMYSFGRKYLHLAIIGCFKEENIHKGLYKIHSESTMAVYKLKVSEEQYDKITSRVEEISKKSNGYNIIGLFLAYFRIRLHRNKYYCSEFVYNVLSDKEINVIKDEEEMFTPTELTAINGLELLYEGRVLDYK